MNNNASLIEAAYHQFDIGFYGIVNEIARCMKHAVHRGTHFCDKAINIAGPAVGIGRGIQRRDVSFFFFQRSGDSRGNGSATTMTHDDSQGHVTYGDGIFHAGDTDVFDQVPGSPNHEKIADPDIKYYFNRDTRIRTADDHRKRVLTGRNFSAAKGILVWPDGGVAGITGIARLETFKCCIGCENWRNSFFWKVKRKRTCLFRYDSGRALLNFAAA